MNTIRYIAFVAAVSSSAIGQTFEEFYATHPDKDIHRASAAYQALIAPPPPPPAPQPEPPQWLRYEQQMNAAWPLLSAHPSTNEIPPAGLSYRLQDGSNITFWIVRQGDLLSTQLSAHDTNGDEIHRTYNVRTREETTVNIRQMTEAKKFADLAASKKKTVKEPKP